VFSLRQEPTFKMVKTVIKCSSAGYVALLSDIVRIKNVGSCNYIY
jgi:hypothetical protein